MKRIACAATWFLVAASLCGTASASPFSVVLGGARTTLKEAAFAYAASYFPDLSDKSTGLLGTYSWGYIKWEPELSLASGGKDALNHVIARADFTGCIFSTTTIAGIPTPKADGVLHDILLTGGVETTDQLDVLAGVAELGYVPWLPKGLRWVNTGAYLQAGYQSHVNVPDTTGGNPLPQDGTVARVRGLLRAEKRFPETGPRAFGVAANGEAWYDLVHSQFYYALKGTLRFYFAEDKSVDVTYERNSGAPKFSDGGQIGLGLALQFGQ